MKVIINILKWFAGIILFVIHGVVVAIPIATLVPIMNLLNGYDIFRPTYLSWNVVIVDFSVTTILLSAFIFVFQWVIIIHIAFAIQPVEFITSLFTIEIKCQDKDVEKIEDELILEKICKYKCEYCGTEYNYYKNNCCNCGGIIKQIKDEF